MQKNTKKAFSLIELSVVILIVSILITGSLGVSKTAINNNKAKVTKERMDTVYKALANFVAVNRRLPCPAMLQLAKGTNSAATTTPPNIKYGQETGDATGVVGTGACTNTYTSSPVASSNLVYGMVPILALGLDPDIAEDGWGTKFSYVVDKRFTLASASTSSTNGFELTQAIPAPDVTPAQTINIINIQSPSGTTVMTNALFALISHGANKAYGFNSAGTAISMPASSLTDDKSNGCQGDNTVCSDPANAFDEVFISSSPSNSNFDDIVLFKNKTQLVKDAGLEFMMCDADEATVTTPSVTWLNTNNGSYNCLVCSGTANTSKICGKYGAWSGLSTTNPTCTPDKMICFGSNYNPDMVIYSHTTTGTGGTAVTNTWTARTLNTTNYEKDDSNSFSPLAANTITLQPGIYHVSGSSSFYGVDYAKLRLQNTFNNTTAISGNSNYFANNTPRVGGKLNIDGVINITVQSNFQIQYYVTSNLNGHDLGSSSGSVNNVFTSITIIKLQ